ncbi:MAG: exodeoxyribonuclease VII small subunit [Candidatus Velthaea sp.]
MAENKAATFEASLERLEQIVAKLESDRVSLDDSVALFKEGRDLARRCEAMLKTAQETIEAAAASPADKEQPAPRGSLFDDDALA